jgi:uncharacterized protein YeaO (DUF488 family)
MIKLKRAYELPAKDDGERYLVDRLWPRGVTRDHAQLTDWLKDLAPSDDLRKWFGHDPERWGEFKRRYKLELRAPAKREIIETLAHKANAGTITLIFAAKDSEHNNAVAIKEVIESRLSSA